MVSENAGKILKLIRRMLFLAMLTLLFHGTPLNEVHGGSDAALIIGGVGGILLIVATWLELNNMAFTVIIGYCLGALMGKTLESEGMVFNNAPIHTMWIVWLVSYIVIILLGLAWDFGIKIKKKRSAFHVIGFLSTLAVAILVVISYVLKPTTIDEIFAHRPHFYGSVLEVRDGGLLLEVDENSFVATSGDLITVGFDEIMPDLSVGDKDFVVGDIVTVYFEGSILESYPLQAGEVYIISDRKIRLVKEGAEINGDLYTYEELSDLMGESIEALKADSVQDSAQFMMDVLNTLRETE